MTLFEFGYFVVLAVAGWVSGEWASHSLDGRWFVPGFLAGMVGARVALTLAFWALRRVLRGDNERSSREPRRVRDYLLDTASAVFCVSVATLASAAGFAAGELKSKAGAGAGLGFGFLCGLLAAAYMDHVVRRAISRASAKPSRDGEGAQAQEKERGG